MLLFSQKNWVWNFHYCIIIFLNFKTASSTHTQQCRDATVCPVLCFCRICSYSLAWARLRTLSLQDPRSLASPHSKRCFSLCLSFPSLFRLLSCALLSYRLSVHPFNLSVCPPVSSSGFLWKVWPEPQATPLNVPVTPPSHAAELSLHPVPAVATPSSSHDLWPRRVARAPLNNARILCFGWRVQCAGNTRVFMHMETWKYQEF